ncbi:MAG: 16S rRNA (guanine(527)-N(7))-methyltransferase RsmG [Firmicutes bacterium]|nr:16S rRNA (guanine(527)-N(7))-methyltransferase RsmG [Bacillota bacterium]MBQ2270353.1 16S rRNA (guanine(527)-N(7))-methyltransferase RsmG [Bacillota bacterium]MBQ5797692.1 16S rRNA (guanine(527)-N(7))-methyltransferase RsmG [Bacillota bacterium]
MKHLLEAVKSLGMELSEEQIRQFEAYRAGVLEWNEKVNLTAITDPEEFEMKHFADSVMSAGNDIMKNAKKIIDVGTGGGFPGIPLAILFPDKQFTLMDSLGKRIKIIDQLAKEIGIKNVELVHARAEDLAKKKEYREQYDVCVSRAVANLATLSEYCIPFVKIGGYFAPYKTAAAEEEIAEGKKALFILGGHLESVSEFSDAELDHTILWIKKVKMTPVKYPRKAGTPSKEPLK